ncbi:MAG: reductase [Solirubrobacteraceae bacterium]|jgi:MsuE subfamily FMN reductase|nr:reductase [Solirubrobacteraceae bacterium]
MYLLGLSGGLKARSKTLLAVRQAVEFATAFDPSIEAEVVNIRDLDMQFCDGREEAYEGDTGRLVDKIVRADGLIIGTPMYRGSYTGLLKNVLDVIPNDAIIGKPVGWIATGGTDHHFLAIEHELKPVLGGFRAYAIPGAVYANNDHYSDDALSDEGVIERLDELARAVVEFAERVPRELVGARPPHIPRRALAER